MEFLREDITHDGGTLVDTVAIVTPASRTEKMAMLIHLIEIIVQQPAWSAGTWQYCEAALSSESHEGLTTLPGIEDPDILHKVKEWAQEGIVANTFTRFREGDFIIYFDPPVLYPKAYLYLEMEVADLQASGKYGLVRVGYTLEKVPDADFIAALVD